MRTLFTPGPVNVSEKLNFIDFESYSPNQQIIKDAIKNIQNNIKEIVAPKFPNNYEVILFSMSGTGAAESILSSLGYAKILNIVNGKNGNYGRRLHDISNTYRKTSKIISNDSGEIYGLEYKEIEKELDENSYDYTTAVMVEESTGILNDIQKIGSYCANNNTKLIVDACTPFGSISINMKKMNISVLISCFEKSVEGVDSSSFIVIEKKLLEDLRKNKKESFYLDINAQFDFLKSDEKLRFSSSTFAILINNLALILLLEEGVEARYERYKEIWSEIIKRAKALDIEYVVPKELQSKIVTAFHIPKAGDVVFKDLFEFLEIKGDVIHSGKIEDFPTFRLANMGQLTKEDVKKLFININEFLTSN